ncbi:Apoptotic protease activating factor 1 [Beggiatoa sp. PS]|nr:Apoptotic protease activating factor 1 [Beggiatoa sp. PS]
MDKKSIQLQYITDESGHKKSVILSLKQFDKFFEEFTQLENQVNHLEKEASQFQIIAKQQKVSHQANEGENSEQHILLLTQHHDLLDNLLGELRQYQEIKSELDRKLQLQKFLTHLETEVQEVRTELAEIKKQSKPATLHHVPTLPTNFMNNLAFVKQFKSQLLAKATDEHKPLLIIQGVSGVGKSLITTHLAQNMDIRQTFPDGIFWLCLGTETDILAQQIKLLHALGESKPDVIDVEQNTKRLQELCKTRACLVILDDVWDAQEALAFNIIGEYSQLLITTSDDHLLEFIHYFVNDTKGYELKPFEEQSAIEFFISCVAKEEITISSIPTHLKELVRACHYLPYALQLVANVARHQPVDHWEALLERLQDEDYEFPDKHPRALMQALHINVEELGESGDYYLALAVFGDYSRIPQFIVIMLWRFLYQILDDDAQSFINNLGNLGLLQIEQVSSKQKYLNLHTFQHDYLCAEADLEKLHGHLLAVYRRQCDQQHGWISGPNDGYFFEHLCRHLYHAKRYNELKLLLLDFDWMQTKLQATSIHNLLMDYEWLEDKEVDIIKKTLYDAAVVLQTEKQELANQLLDRLWYEKSLANNKDVRALLNQAKESSPNWHGRPEFPDEKEQRKKFMEG